jgi:hypothetical protein
MSGRPSERMEEFGSQWTDFHNIDISIFFFRKSVQKIQVLLQFDKNNGYFT